jgi:hypothetical protein
MLTLTLQPWLTRIEPAFQASLLPAAYGPHFISPRSQGRTLRPGAHCCWAGRQDGWLSPNDCREETGWPRFEGGDDIAPQISGGKPADQQSADEPPPAPAPPPEPDEKVFRFPTLGSQND